jgi:hypothetical protein
VLLADAPLDALPEQVGVPVAAGVLLDHVHEQLAQRDRLTLGVAAGEVGVVVNCSAKAVTGHRMELTSKVIQPAPSARRSSV